MRIIDCVQGTGEWWEAKRGIPSASNFDLIITPKKQQASASQLPFITRLIEDIKNPSPNYFTGQGGPVNAATDYGRQTEDEARRWYQIQPGAGEVTQVGFCLTDDGRFGCSPDGLVDPDGGLELKCPERHTHLLYLLEGGLPLEYKCQVHGCLVVTGRKWWDFVSYCKNEEQFRIRVEPDAFTKAMRIQLEVFDAKYQAAKKRFKITAQEDEPLTDLTKQTVEEHARQLLDLQETMKKLGFQHGMDKVNDWIRDMQDKPDRPAVPYQTKREVWRLIEGFSKRQDPPWFFDTVNRMFRKEKSIAF